MTPAQLLSALAAVRHYARHDDACSQSQSGCICGLRDTLRGIDAMLAGNHPEAPESSKESDDGS